MSDDRPKLSIGGREIVAASGRPKRLAGLLWGSAGAGKTTLAATAPGRKLIFNFDPDGYTSVSDYPNVDVIDFSDPGTAIAEQFKKSSNPLGINEVMDEYDTFIFDSLTNIGYKALQHAIPQVKGATVERPSPGAYQIRNALVLQLVKNVLAVTSKHNKHVFFIAHEDAPVTNDEGMVLHITLSLGGKLPEQTALDFSEVWYVQDLGAGRNRRILIRPARSRKPMKTRMFETSGDVEFDWVFDPDDQEGMTISDWYDQWCSTGKKVPLPKEGKKAKK